jgi:DNA transformation protein
MASASADGFRDFVLDQLGDGVQCRAMFGGHGLYREDVFFGLLFRGRFYLRVDDATRTGFEAAGMKPFRPAKGRTMRSYYEVPADVLENRDLCRAWAARAAAIGRSRRTGPGRP